MFARVSKQFVTGIRRFSNDSGHSDLESWIKIYEKMQHEAGAKAESAVSGVKSEIAIVKSDVYALRSEVTSLKTDLNQVKSDVRDLAKGQIEIHKQMSGIHDKISNLHNQGVNQTRLILAGGAAIASTFFAANQYVEYLKEEKRKQPTVK